MEILDISSIRKKNPEKEDEAKKRRVESVQLDFRERRLAKVLKSFSEEAFPINPTFLERKLLYGGVKTLFLRDPEDPSKIETKIDIDFVVPDQKNGPRVIFSIRGSIQTMLLRYFVDELTELMLEGMILSGPEDPVRGGKPQRDVTPKAS